MAELGDLVKGDLDSTFCPGASATERLTYLLVNRKLSCFKGYNHIVYFLIADPVQFDFMADANTGEVAVSTNEHWSASVNAEAENWITIVSGSGTGSGTMSFSILGNIEPMSRGASITISTTSGLSVIIMISQAPG
jgi:hypothetical protein